MGLPISIWGVWFIYTNTNSFRLKVLVSNILKVYSQRANLCMHGKSFHFCASLSKFLSDFFFRYQDSAQAEYDRKRILISNFYYFKKTRVAKKAPALVCRTLAKNLIAKNQKL